MSISTLHKGDDDVDVVVDDDNNNNNNTQKTQLTNWIFFVYPFLTVRSLIPHSTTTNLHLFLSLSYSFLSVFDQQPAYSYRFFIPASEIQMDYRFLQEDIPVFSK